MSMIGNYLAISSDTASELESEPSSIEALLFADDLGDSEFYVDTDKAWQGIHYLLTGTAWEGDAPLSWVVMPPRELGEDVGYGPARLLKPDEVKAVALAVSGISPEALNEKYDPAALEKAEIYPQGWGAEDANYISGNYKSVKALFERAATLNMAMLVWLN